MDAEDVCEKWGDAYYGDYKESEGVGMNNKDARLVFSITKADLIRQTFRAGGKGGQKQNKVETGVRFIHPPSGARGEARDTRSQKQNEELAFMRMAQSAEFQRWAKIEATKRMGGLVPETPEQIRQRVDREVDTGLQNGTIIVEEGLVC